MAVVKGSKQETLRVVRSRPWLPLLLCGMSVIGVVAAALIAYRIGSYRSVSDEAYLEATLQKSMASVADLTAENALLQQKLTNATLGADIDRQSNEDVRQEVAALTMKLAKLEEDNRFYRNLIAPTENKRGLSFGGIEIVNSPDDRRFSFKIVVQQLSTTHKLLSGKLMAKINGTLNGEPKSYNLSELSQDITSADIKLRFKYFQEVAGTLTLPEGFDATGLNLTAQSAGKGAVTIEKNLGWVVENRGNYAQQ